MALGQQNRYTTVTRGGAVDRGAIDAGLRQYMLGVYNYMWQGLLVSGAVAWIIATVPAVRQVFYTTVDGQVVGLSGLGIDRKSTRLNPVTNAHLVCRLLLEKKKKGKTDKI